LSCAAAAVSLASASGSERIPASAIICEINIARQDPVLYATYVEELRSHYDRGFVVFPEGTKWRMKEGLAAVDEALRFLRAARLEQPLTLSPGMCHAAADHCDDQVGGRTGHRGSDGSNPGDRLSRYGVWSGLWGENIAYGKTTAREIVLTLIIDDGFPRRPHRKNILNPSFHYGGVAYGPHRHYGSVCTMNFADGYSERPAKALIGRNF
jgi:uncharacterized protein YkwD